MEIGNRIKSLRLEHGLTQKELADRCELSKGFISLLERDLTSPSIATLMDILEIFDVKLESFFKTDTIEKIVFTKEDVFVKEDHEEGHTIEWLISNAQKKDMEPIIAMIEPGMTLFDEEAHDGEEFGYVLNGSVSIVLEKKKFKVKKGESFYFKSNVDHKVLNEGKVNAKVLMVSTPPNF